MEKHNLHSRGTLGLNDHSDDGNTFTDVCVATDTGVSSEKSVRLFGVKLIDYNPPMGMMRKSVSMGNLGLVGFSALQRCQESHVHTESVTAAQAHSEAGDGIAAAAHGKPQQGYVSDGLMQTSSMCLRERKKGVPWTEEEHRLFLAGLQTLGKGDWRGISRNFVTSRTPTQVASHAQKYFLRQCNLNKRKRRSSLFDIINSTMVRTGTDIGMGEHTHSFASTELNQSTVKLGLQHVMTSSTSPMNSFSPYSKLPSTATQSPTLRADLCLGRSYTQQRRMLADDILSTAAPVKQSSMLNTLRSTDFLSSNHPADGEKTNFNTSIYTTSSLSSSPKSLSSSPSSSSSLCRIDEMSELSSLSLRIGPPVSLEASELVLKLEQPTISSRHSAIRSSARVCEVEEVFCAAGASTVSGNTNTVTRMANAISVV